MHHENGFPVFVQAVQPCPQKIVQGGFADLDGRVAPDDIEAHRFSGDTVADVIGVGHEDRIEMQAPSIVEDQVSSPLVHIDRPDPCLGTAQRHGHGDGAGAGTEIQEDTGVGEIGCFAQEDLGSRIEAAMGKHTGIGLQLEGQIRQDDASRTSTRAHLRLRIEIVRSLRASGNETIGDGPLVGGVFVGVVFVESGHDTDSLTRMSYEIRTFGDPVLATRAGEVGNIDGKIVRIVDEMFETLYRSDSGIGLAAPQVGIQRQIFVWDMDDDPRVVINPRIVESDGEWVYDEGCLSIPGLYVEMTRPKRVLMEGVDLNGNEVSLEADELEARLFQHELDHLNGVLMFDRMQPEQRKRAMEEYKRLVAQGTALSEPVRLSAE